MTVVEGEIVEAAGRELAPLFAVGELPALVSAPVRDLVSDWLAAVTGDEPSRHTIKAYLADIGAWFGWYLDRYPDGDVLRVRRTDVDLYAKQMAVTPTRLGRPPSKATRARKLSTIASFYGYCVEEDIPGVIMPVRSKARPKVPNVSTTRALDQDEALRFLARLDQEPIRDEALCRVLLDAGVRVSEATGANLGDWRPREGAWTITVVGKGNRTRTVAVHDATALAVNTMLAERAAAAGVADVEQLDQDKPLFARVDGSQHTTRSVTRMLQRICRAAGISDPGTVTPHVLRHSCATLLRDAGGSLDVIRDRLGHISITTTERYERGRRLLQRSIEAANRLAKHLTRTEP